MDKTAPLKDLLQGAFTETEQKLFKWVLLNFQFDLVFVFFCLFVLHISSRVFCVLSSRSSVVAKTSSVLAVNNRFLSLSVCIQNNSKSYQRILSNFLAALGSACPKNEVVRCWRWVRFFCGFRIVQDYLRLCSPGGSTFPCVGLRALVASSC